MRRPGFTLIELLIVVAIIGILAAIAIPNFMNARIRAVTARARAEMRGVVMAHEQYRIDWNAYLNDGNDPFRPSPPAQYSMPLKFLAHNNDSLRNFCNINVFKPLTTPVAYLSSLPTDPFFPAHAVDAGLYKGVALGFPYFYDTVWEPTGGGGINTQGGDGIIFWVMSAMGPDLRAGDAIRDNPGGPKGYDPSNGIRSEGDVIRLPTAVNVAKNPGTQIQYRYYRAQGAE